MTERDWHQPKRSVNNYPSRHPPTDAVIEAVAAREGIDPVNLTDSLCDAIDPDSLNAVCRTSTVRVTFSYHGYHVTVHSDNQVELTEISRH